MPLSPEEAAKRTDEVTAKGKAARAARAAFQEVLADDPASTVEAYGPRRRGRPRKVQPLQARYGLMAHGDDEPDAIARNAVNRDATGMLVSVHRVRPGDLPSPLSPDASRLKQQLEELVADSNTQASARVAAARTLAETANRRDPRCAMRCCQSGRPA
jgi:hypothetical protein